MISFKLLCSVVSMINWNKTLEFSIVPNPTRGTIRIIGTAAGETIQIINSIGKMVYTKTAQDNSEKINLSHLSNGIYLVMITDEDGNNKTQKIIKN